MRYLVIILLSILFWGCETSTPTLPAPEIKGKDLAFILCEGVWGSSNSTLDAYDADNHTQYLNYFKSVNGFNIGDTGNSYITDKDTVYAAVTSTSVIVKLLLPTLKFLGKIELPANAKPRYMSFDLNSNLLATDLYEDKIWVCDKNSLQVKSSLKTGPAPEDIILKNKKLYVLNSGLGDYRKTEENAGTLSIIENENVRYIPLVKNPINIINTSTNLIYLTHINLPSEKDSLGGIIEFDTAKDSITRRWHFKLAKAALDKSEKLIYFINETGAHKLDLSTGETTELLVKSAKNDQWYGLALKNQNELWICNAKNYTVNGEVIILDLISNTIVKKFETSINPNNIIFYK